MAKQDNFIPSNANIIESLVASITNQEMLVEFISNSADNIVKIIESTKGKITKDSLESIQQLDVCISSLNNIISSICELKIKDALTLPMKLPILEQSLVILMNSLSSMADGLAEMEEFQAINKKLNEVIITLNTLKGIVDVVTNFPKVKIKDIIHIHISLTKLFFVIKTICNRIEKNLSKLKIDRKVVDTIESVKLIIDSLNTLTENLIKFSKTSMKLLLVAIPLIIGLFTTLTIVWVIIKILGLFKKLNGSLNTLNITLTIKSLSEIIGGLKKLAEDLIKFAGASALLVLISPVVILGVLFTLLIIKAIMFLIQRLMSLSKSKSLIQVFIVIFLIKKLLVELLMIVGLLFLLALAAVIMIKFYEILLLGLLAIVVIMLIIAGIAFVLKMVAKIISFTAMIKIFLFMVLLLLLIGFIFLMALMLTKIAAMKNDILDGFLDFLIVTGVILGIGTALSLLGYLLIYLVPGMLMAMAFIGLVFLSVLLILLLALSLKLLTKMKFSKDEVEIIKDNVKNIMSAARAALDIMLQEAFGVGEEDSGIMKVIKSVLGGLAAIIELVAICMFVALTIVAVALVIVLALVLKLLAKINFSKNEVETIKANVRNIITAASEVILAITSPFEDVEKDESKQSTMDKIMEAILPDWINVMLRALGAILMLIPTIIAVGLVIFLGKTLQFLTDIIIDKDIIAENVRTIISTAAEIITIVNNPMDGVETDDGQQSILDKIIEWILPENIGFMLQALGAILMLIPTIMAVGLVIFLGKVLTEIGSVNIPSDLETKITNIIQGAKTVVAVVNRPIPAVKSDKSKEGWLVKLARAILPDNLVDMILSLGAILMLIPCITACGAIVSLAQSLKEVGSFNFTPQVIEQKTTSIISCAKRLVSMVNNAEIAEISEWKLRLQKAIIDMSIGLCERIVKVLNLSFNEANADTIIKQSKKIISILTDKNIWNIPIDTIRTRYIYMNSLVALINRMIFVARRVNNDDINKTVESTASIISILTNKDNWGSISEMEKRSNILDKLVNTLNKLADIGIKPETEKFVDTSERFIKTLSNTDLSKLETAEKIFKNMAEFSQSIKGDFDALAEALTEKIAPLLEQISESTSKIPDKMDEQVAQQEFESAPINTPVGALRELFNKFNPSASKEEADKRVSQKVTQQSQQNNAILETNELLTEIKNILKSQMI